MPVTLTVTDTVRPSRNQFNKDGTATANPWFARCLCVLVITCFPLQSIEDDHQCREHIVLSDKYDGAVLWSTRYTRSCKVCIISYPLWVANAVGGVEVVMANAVEH